MGQNIRWRLSERFVLLIAQAHLNASLQATTRRIKRNSNSKFEYRSLGGAPSSGGEALTVKALSMLERFEDYVVVKYFEKYLANRDFSEIDTYYSQIPVIRE